jgi:hypothetical protein
MVANALAGTVSHAALCAALYCTEHNPTELLALGGRLARNERDGAAPGTGPRIHSVSVVHDVAKYFADAAQHTVQRRALHS